jgi:hypothetical protein
MQICRALEYETESNFLTIAAGPIYNTRSKRILRASSQNAFAGLPLTTLQVVR